MNAKWYLVIGAAAAFAVLLMPGCESWLKTDFRGESLTPAQIEQRFEQEKKKIENEAKAEAAQLELESRKLQRQYESAVRAAERESADKVDRVTTAYTEAAESLNARIAQLPALTSARVDSLQFDIDTARAAIDEKLGAFKFIADAGQAAAGMAGPVGGPFSIAFGALGAWALSKRREDKVYDQAKQETEAEVAKRDAAWDASQAEFMKMLLAMSGKSLPVPGEKAGA